jgi:hypothetical protein
MGKLYEYLSADHDRMDALLTSAVARAEAIDMAPYSEFRKRLLRHISMEEKIILPAIAKWQGGKKVAIAERLRMDHGAIVSLLVPPPTPSIVRTLRSIFSLHNPLEEGGGGLYQLLEELAGAESDRMLSELIAAPDVLVLPHNEQPDVLEVTKRAVARAGYEFRDV